jgi:peptide/nickel transport system ATP-binding protein
MLDLNDVSVSYGGQPAVRTASLRVGAGERLGIVGESGSGKSTLAMAMMGMTPETATVSGSIRIDGQELAGASEAQWRRLRGSRIGMIFQEPLAALNPLRRVGDTVAEPLRVLAGMTRAQARTRVRALFDEVGLADPDAKAAQYPHELSGGQRQRVLIALALARDPDILIADEPTTALDAQVALRVIALLVELTRRREMALVFISHDLSAVARATQRLAVMYAGDIVETGATDDILSDPRHPYSSGLVAARPRLDRLRGRGQRMPTIPGVVPALADMPAGCRFAGRCPNEMPDCGRLLPERHELAGARKVACHLLNGKDAPARLREFA